jgi:hypothetical protein
MEVFVVEDAVTAKGLLGIVIGLMIIVMLLCGMRELCLCGLHCCIED